ncbi:MAG: class I SAM-dependent methyltransferase [Parachlamydiaceae bacterium]|nr:class I SAM-dependent methyltransferase [Parachlamydiaceae bacterium]
MQVSNEIILQNAIEQHTYLKNFKVLGKGKDASLYSYQKPESLLNKLRENIFSFEKLVEDLPTTRISFGYSNTEFMVEVLKRGSIERINLFIRKAIQLHEITATQFEFIQYELAYLSKIILKNNEQKKIYTELKQHLQNFSKSSSYIYDRAQMTISDLSTKVSLCSAFVKNFKVKKSLEDLEKEEAWGHKIKPKKKPFECRHYISNIMAFVKRYKKIDTPAALIFFIREYPLLFMEKILPDLSIVELQSLVEFTKMEEINKRIFKEEDNRFNFLDFLIKNGGFAFIEEKLNSTLTDAYRANWLSYKENFLELEKIKEQIEQEFNQKQIESVRSEYTDNFVYSSNISTDLRERAKIIFSNMLKSLFVINHRDQPKKLEHYVSFKLMEAGNELNYIAEINSSNKIFKPSIPLEGFKVDSYFQSFRNYSVVLLNKKSALTYVYKYNPSFFLSYDWTAKILSGDQTEKVSSTNIHQPNYFWNYWEKEAISGYKLYKNIIHPCLKHVVLQILSTYANSSPTVLEICGGKGQLAKSILDERPDIRYTLLESNGISIKTACETLNGRANVIKMDIVKDSFPVAKESVDVFFGSGAFTYEVLEGRNAGMQVIKKISIGLKKGGFLVLSGLAPSLFTAEEFIMSGFKVLNMSASDEKSFKAIQLYILRK